MSSMDLEAMTVDTANLYREEMYTDMKVATIRRMIPIKADGSDDESRESFFTGQTQVMSQMGPIPINCQLEAKDLQEACDKFPEAIKASLEQMMEEAREMQRQEASRIVVPKGGAAGGADAGSILQMP